MNPEEIIPMDTADLDTDFSTTIEDIVNRLGMQPSASEMDKISDAFNLIDDSFVSNLVGDSMNNAQTNGVFEQGDSSMRQEIAGHELTRMDSEESNNVDLLENIVNAVGIPTCASGLSMVSDGSSMDNLLREDQPPSYGTDNMELPTAEITGNFDSLLKLYGDAKLSLELAVQKIEMFRTTRQSNDIPCLLKCTDGRFTVCSPREAWHLLEVQIHNHNLSFMTENQRSDMSKYLKRSQEEETVLSCIRNSSPVGHFLDKDPSQLPLADISSASQPNGKHFVALQLGIVLLFKYEDSDFFTDRERENFKAKMYRLQHNGNDYFGVIYWFKLQKQLDREAFSFEVAPDKRNLSGASNHYQNFENGVNGRVYFVKERAGRKFICSSEMATNDTASSFEVSTNVSTFIKPKRRQLIDVHQNFEDQYEKFGFSVVGHFTTALCKILPTQFNKAHLFSVTKILNEITTKTSRKLVSSNEQRIMDLGKEMTEIERAIRLHTDQRLTRYTSDNIITALNEIGSNAPVLGQAIKGMAETISKQAISLREKDEQLQRITAENRENVKEIVLRLESLLVEKEAEIESLKAENRDLREQLETMHNKMLQMENHMSCIKKEVQFLMRHHNRKCS
ncbi:uncharacterized protein LOC144453288 [Glandiceps talaboti]